MEGRNLRLRVGTRALSQGNFQTCWCCGSCLLKLDLEVILLMCDGFWREGMKVWVSGGVGESWSEAVEKIP